MYRPAENTKAKHSSPLRNNQESLRQANAFASGAPTDRGGDSSGSGCVAGRSRVRARAGGLQRKQRRCAAGSLARAPQACDSVSRIARLRRHELPLSFSLWCTVAEQWPSHWAPSLHSLSVIRVHVGTHLHLDAHGRLCYTMRTICYCRCS